MRRSIHFRVSTEGNALSVVAIEDSFEDSIPAALSKLSLCKTRPLFMFVLNCRARHAIVSVPRLGNKGLFDLPRDCPAYKL